MCSASRGVPFARDGDGDGDGDGVPFAADASFPSDEGRFPRFPSDDGRIPPPFEILSNRAKPSRAAANTATAAPNSMGSPNAVPVPCISSASAGRSNAGDAPRAAAVNTACCDGPFGAVSDADRPSWFTADDTIVVDDARITAAAAGDAAPLTPPTVVDHRGIAHTASVRTYPSASASSVLHRPSGASIPAAANMLVACGASTRAAPATTAPTVTPPNPDPDPDPDPATASRATCAATRDDEHAVSIARLAPLNPNVYEMRPHAAETAFPAPRYGFGGAPVTSGTTRE